MGLNLPTNSNNTRSIVKQKEFIFTTNMYGFRAKISQNTTKTIY